MIGAIGDNFQIAASLRKSAAVATKVLKASCDTQQLTPAVDVPESCRAVVASGGKKVTVGMEGDVQDLSGVPIQSQYAFLHGLNRSIRYREDVSMTVLTRGSKPLAVWTPI